VTNYAAILEVYSIQDILELNDITEEEALDFLVTQDFLVMPSVRPIDFD
jgi:hypothetical protein